MKQSSLQKRKVLLEKIEDIKQKERNAFIVEMNVLLEEAYAVVESNSLVQKKDIE